VSLVLTSFEDFDEDQATLASRNFPDSGFPLFGHTSSMSWSDYLASLVDWRAGRRTPEGEVRAFFAAARVDGELVGSALIRFELNDQLAFEGGHVGYGVLPQFRRRGYATQILQQAVLIARSDGVSSVLVTCDDSNTGSIGVIAKCGGVWESVETNDEGTRFRQYRI
jgi:predicted acetyltransferase